MPRNLRVKRFTIWNMVSYFLHHWKG
jgi:hypothetical protein